MIYKESNNDSYFTIRLALCVNYDLLPINTLVMPPKGASKISSSHVLKRCRSKSANKFGATECSELKRNNGECGMSLKRIVQSAFLKKSRFRSKVEQVASHCHDDEILGRYLYL